MVVRRLTAICALTWGFLAVAPPAARAANNALSFDGLNDYVQFSELFTNTTTFSMSLWVNSKILNDGGYHGLLGKQGDACRKPSLWLAPSSGGLHYDSYDPTCATRYSGIINNVFTSTNTWYHIAWVKNGTTYSFYKNGALVATASAPASFYTTSTAYWIGRIDNYWNGLIDEVRIYNRALTASEISAHYNAGAGQYGQPESGLVGGWHLDEGTGTVANDYSGTGKTGTLLNGPTWVPGVVAASQSVAAPTMSPAGGTFTGSVQVTLSTATTGASIRYTTDGSTPTSTSAVYAAPFTLTATATVKAQAFKSGMTDSTVTSASFAMALAAGTTGLTATAAQTSAMSANWQVVGTEKYSYGANEWLEYLVNVGSTGPWLFSLTAINQNSPTEPALPAGYAYNIALSVDGVSQGSFSVPGSTTIYQTGSSAPISLSVGTHTIRFTWTNDAWSQGLYDANIRVKQIAVVPSTPTDTTPPVISAVSSSNITSTGATITWTTNESATSQVEYGLTASYGQSTTLDPTLVTAHTVTLSGLSASTLYHSRVKSKDAANNLATGADFSFTTAAPPDTTPPTGSVTINGGAAATNTAAVTLTLSATDTGGAVTQMQFSNDGTTFTAPEAYATTKTWTLSAGDGTKTVSVKFKDAAGNWSAAVNDTISLDTTPPSLAITSPADGAVLVAPSP